MTEYELDQICQRTACDCKCMKCPYFAQNQREELGLDDDDDDDYYDEDEGYEDFEQDPCINLYGYTEDRF